MRVPTPKEFKEVWRVKRHRREAGKLLSSIRARLMEGYDSGFVSMCWDEEVMLIAAEEIAKDGWELKWDASRINYELHS